MIEIKNLSIKVNDRYLIKDLTLNLNKNDKLAIIGEEGNGKSTLLKCIIDKCDYAEITGTINLNNNKIGYLEQNIKEEYKNQKVNDYIFIDDIDYYNKINNFYKYLEILNLKDNILDKYLNTLSGGEKIKIAILKLLLNDNDVLLLDEPTNDLDIETLLWLENFINRIDIPIIYISHDETLLSKTANMILHLESLKRKTECKHTLLKIRYEEYVDLRLRTINNQTQIHNFERKELEKREEKLKKQKQRVEFEQNNISRSDPHGGRLLKKKMHNIKSQERKIENLDITEKPDPEEAINFIFEKVYIPNDKKILSLNLDILKVKNNILSKNIELNIRGNEHICIIGKNGVGKTTLIRIIYDNLKDRKDIKIGYMPQDYSEAFDGYDNVLDYITNNSKNKDEITKVRMYLGNMKFTSEEMISKINNLSGGSKAKLILMKLVLEKSNVLILDEPTRNVSPLSNPVIRKVLKEFKGTIISVSHDRKYIEEVINKLYVLTNNGLNLIRKDDYIEKLIEKQPKN